MGPINDILKPFKIRLNFDTALPINSGWIYCLEKRPHPITAGIDNDYDTGIWVGASLDIAPPARPVIIGKLGWADRGDYSNRKRAFLGDYKRDSQEQLGDVVLVAESVYGKGRVLVFGDTSSFQNGVIANTHFFLDRVFSWLSSAGTKYYPAQQGLAALALLMLAGYMLARRPNVLLYFACALAANAVLWLDTCYRSEMTGPEPSAPGFAKPSFYKPACIDISHMERFAPFASSDNSLWGLSINLMRNRYMPLFMKEISGTDLAEADLLIVNSPAVPFTRNETGLLKDFLQKGGSIIWAVGWEEFEASKSFLSEFGLSVDSVPLGSAEIKLKKATVKFVEAWPVTGGSDLKQIIIEKWGHAIIVYQPVGRGGILLIGDSEFLHSRNIESYKTYNPGNIRFIRYLLNKLGELKTN
jgi:hypothetical protein